jgi:two-component system, cell cycle sensor histidine kinase and response regulator CckA
VEKEPSAAWFRPEQQRALIDFWQVYQANITIAAITREATDEPALVEIGRALLREYGERGLREELSRAFAGDWAPYEASLRRLGAFYAERGFAGWSAITTTLARRLIPVMVETYHAEPERLTAALVVMAEFFDRVGKTLGDAYVTAAEAIARDAHAQLRASAAELRQSEERHRLFFEASPVPLLVFDEESLAFLAVNDAALEMYGYSREELLGLSLTDVKAERGDGEGRTHRRRDGSLIHLEITSRPLTFEGRDARLAVAVDVTEKAGLEAQLRQSQKMEAIGSLAGGVAHDFNNLLSVILGYSELVAEGLGADDPRRSDLDEVQQAGARAAALTRQLLAFGRRQVLQPKTVKLNEIVASVERMLQRLIGEDIELMTVLQPSLSLVTVDPGQFEQVIMNLAVNARDAMPRGGTLTIETAEVDLDESDVREHAGAKTGRNVVLAVRDNGVGMSEETKTRIFEPFFTTKELGKGTGLGLSTVFGIVRQSGGSIRVRSELGKGTTMEIYLPAAVAERPAVSLAEPGPLRMPHGTETILLVEDDAGVRNLAHAILARAGYRVLVAQSGEEAERLSEQHPETIHLLLTDVVMPRVSGREVAERLHRARPAMRVLYMSGYTDDAIVRHGILHATIEFLPKPITPDSLTRKVRDVLDATPD